MLDLVLLVAFVVDVVKSSTSVYSSDLELSDDYYVTVEIGIGTPSQDFDVLVDTTNSVTWVFDDSVSNLESDQTAFVVSDSSTYTSSSGVFTYTYFNGSTNGTEGVDTIVIGSSYNMTNEKFGLGLYDDQFFKDVGVSGSLSLNRESDVISHIQDDGTITSAITFDIDSKKIHIGDYSASYKNSSEVNVVTDVSSISNYWSFSFDSLSSDSTASLLSCGSNCYAIIDSASPYLTFALDSDTFSSLWKNIAGTNNCDKSTLECDSEDDIAYYLEFTIGNDSYYLSRSDYYYDDKLHILRTDEVDSTNIAVFVGRPFLKTMDVKLNVDNETLTFSYTKSSSSSTDKWQTVWITAICVIAFALIFFGIFFYKFKIPPHTTGTHEEQALLGQPLGSQSQANPAVQPVPSGTQAVGSATGASQTNDPDEMRRRRLQMFESGQQQDEDQGQV